MLKKLLTCGIWVIMMWGLTGYTQAQNRPDLVVQPPVSLPSTVLAGGVYPLSAVIKNQGTNGSQFNCIGYYLSKDAAWDATDTYLGASCQSLLFPGQAGTCAIIATMPLVASGAYSLLLVADPLNAEQESDESNNVAAFAVTVTGRAVALPDLELWRPSLSFSTLPAGGQTGVFSFLYNRGEGGAAAHEISFFLSTDTVFSMNSDVQLGTVLMAGLSGTTGTGGTGVGTVFSAPVLPVPAATAPGSYYLIIMIDPRNLLAESNKQNNSRALPLRITGPVTRARAAQDAGVEVYPNPVDYAGCTLRWTHHRIGRVEVLNGQGRRVATQQCAAAGGAAVQLDTSFWPAGLYTVRLTDTNGETVTRRVARH
ncbi:CARDB domain-containing protein [Hymenobacter sp. UYP22]|uniref:CARDB domain-containing protein n=1 Tax=Hymenobacter sp. UYP22 TaxID=3156348 RepID=UPI0033965F11